MRIATLMDCHISLSVMTWCFGGNGGGSCRNCLSASLLSELLSDFNFFSSSVEGFGLIEVALQDWTVIVVASSSS